MLVLNEWPKKDEFRVHIGHIVMNLNLINVGNMKGKVVTNTKHVIALMCWAIL